MFAIYRTIFSVAVNLVLCSGINVENSTDFLEWFKNAIAVDVPNLELIDFGNKSYYIETSLTASYFQATQFCNFHKMRLVSVTSQKENDFLEKTISELSVSKYHFWTSGTALPSGHWVWLSSGRPIAYTNWDEGEPNGGNQEVCLEMRTTKHGLTWNDLKCSTNMYFICECSSLNIFRKQNEKNVTESGTGWLIEPRVKAE